MAVVVSVFDMADQAYGAGRPIPAVCTHFRLHVRADAQIRARRRRAQQNVARFAVLRIVANRIARIKFARLQQVAGTGEASPLMANRQRQNTSQPAPEPLTEWNCTSCDISAASLAPETSLARLARFCVRPARNAALAEQLRRYAQARLVGCIDPDPAIFEPSWKSVESPSLAGLAKKR